MIKIFKGNDIEYFEWLKSHRRGYILNTDMHEERLFWLHYSDCSHITDPSVRKGAYTERNNIKIYADEFEEIETRYKDKLYFGNKLKICSTCLPQIT